MACEIVGVLFEAEPFVRGIEQSGHSDGRVDSEAARPLRFGEAIDWIDCLVY